MRAWEEFLHKQDLEIGKQTVDKWLRSLKIICFDACNLYLEAKDFFYVLWFEEHMRHKVKLNFFNNNNKLIKVHLNIVKSQEKEEFLTNSKNPLLLNTDLFSMKVPSNSLKMHFESFVTFIGNELSWNLLKEMTSEIINLKKQERTLNFNPIYLFGPSGAGKTHLMLASMNLLKKAGKNVIYVEANLFTDHVVSAIRKSEMEKFRSIYRNVDAFFVDNIDVLSGKFATQEEFFHTFNALHLEGKLIVISSIHSPQNLEDIEHRLISRFEWGIVVPIQNLDEENILCLINDFMKNSAFSLTKETMLFLYNIFNRNAKTLLKALETLLVRISKKTLSSNILNEEIVREVIGDLLALEEGKKLTPNKIIQKVSDYYGVRIDDILGKSQSKECVLPRQVAMYLCRENLGMSYVKIGSVFSRDHSTVMSSIKQVGVALNNMNSEFSFSMQQIKESF